MSRAIPKLELSLLALRIGIAAVMLPWSLDKIVRPEHSAKVFDGFYGLPGLGEPVFMVLGAAQLVLVLMFLLGVARTLSYGGVLILHAFSTFSSWRQYLDPYDGINLLFFAAWPMLAACLALFLLRDHDRLLVVGKKRRWSR